MPDLEHSGAKDPKDERLKAEQQGKNEDMMCGEPNDVQGLNKENVENKGESKKYPERTQEAQDECKKVVEVANGIKGNDAKNPVISVFTHEDKTVSVGVSGNGPKTAKFAEDLQKALDEREPGKYRVCGSTDEALMETMRSSGRGVPGNPLGQCAEPKAASAASKSKSPITGMDTRWRSGAAPERYQYTSDKSQMAPGAYSPGCQTCISSLRLVLHKSPP